VNPQLIILGQNEFVFEDNSTGAVTWLWDFGDGTNSTDPNPTYGNYSNTGTYIVTLTVTDANGCTDSTQHSVLVTAEYLLWIPNTFTPNGDGKNDFWPPYPMGVNINEKTFEMYIYNRWGQIVYQSTDITKRWNGTMNNSGSDESVVMESYVYKIKLKDLNGIKHEYYGHVNLIP
jgi:gliding motility-associated-like protein